MTTCRIRNQIDNLLASDRALSLVVAIETALEDKRFEVCALYPVVTLSRWFLCIQSAA
jgi:hypothetical protein